MEVSRRHHFRSGGERHEGPSHEPSTRDVSLRARIEEDENSQGRVPPPRSSRTHDKYSNKNSRIDNNDNNNNNNTICRRDVHLTACLMAVNFCSAVGIVVVNKALFRRGDGVRFATILTALHLFATAAGVRLCRAFGMYEVKSLRQTQVLPITICFCAFVVFSNMNLQRNGVSFYQLTKILTTPAVVILQRLFYRVTLPRNLAMNLVPICLGVAMATVSDTGVSMEGAFWALAGLLAAAAYQVLVKSKQGILQASSLQLLHYQAPQAACFVLVASPLFDDTGKLLSFVRDFFVAEKWAWSGSSSLVEGEEGVMVWAAMVFLSCSLAFVVNLTSFLVIGRTSPVSYQVLGHFKLVVILTAGVTVFGESASPWCLAGMSIALSGIVGYTALKQGLGDGWEG